jgi:putative membrane protein
MMGIGGFGMIWMLLFWVGLIVVAIWLVALLFPSTKTQDTDRNDPSPSAPEILRERYARGELSTDQYKEMLKTIEQ